MSTVIGVMVVQSDSGKMIRVGIKDTVDSTIKQIKEDEISRKATMTNKRIWNLIDTSNKFFRIYPTEQGAVGRSALNQTVFEGVLHELGRKLPKE